MSQLSHKAIGLILTTVFVVQPTVIHAQTFTAATYQPRTQVELIAYLYSIVVQLQAQLLELQQGKADSSSNSNGVTISTRNYPNPYYVIVTSLAPTSIGRTAVTFRGEVDKGSSAYLDVWFEYGEGRRLTNTVDVGQVTKGGRQAVAVYEDDLDTDTTYSYRLVVEDVDGHRHYGQTYTFTTIESAQAMTFTGKPDIETEGANNITAVKAQLSGFASMNDYGTGQVFVVYGTDRSDISDVDEEDAIGLITAVYPSVRAVVVNKSFTGRNTFTINLSKLAAATKYYYRACVEYYDDGDTSDPAVRCGEVESFTTLN